MSLENTCIIGAVNVAATLIGLFLVDRVGRKFLLLAGAPLLFCLYGCGGFFFFFFFFGWGRL